MTRADYFYITSYPTYSGFRVEHDPSYTAYISTEGAKSLPESVPSWRIHLLFGIGIATAVVIGAVLWRKRGSHRITKIPSKLPTTETP